MVHFFKFRFQIWNQHKILHFLIPTLTYLKKKKLHAVNCFTVGRK